VPQEDGSLLALSNAALVWVPLLVIATFAAWVGMNDIASSKASIREQLPVLKRPHMWLLSLLYLATFGSFIGFSAGFAMLAKTQFPDVNILKLAFFGPFIGALARSFGGIISDRLGGVGHAGQLCADGAVYRPAVSHPPRQRSGSFLLLRGVYGAVPDRRSRQRFHLPDDRRDLSPNHPRQREETRRQRRTGPGEAVTDTAAALGFISAIGAIGGFFIPKAFGTSLAMTGSPVGAMKVFLVFYVVCVLVTWLVYGRRKPAKQ
jgi:NNP family nitrate/nitrite transporter-like MFS transporter